MAPGIAAVKNSFMGGVLEKSAVESIRCTIVSFLPFGHGSPEGEKAGKKRPAIANTITERTRHLIRLIQGTKRPFGVLRYAALRWDPVDFLHRRSTAGYRDYCSRNQRKVKRPAGGQNLAF